MNILVTGCAGFIGFHVAQRLLEDGYTVVGADNVNDYYDIGLKEARLSRLNSYERFYFRRLAIENNSDVIELFNGNEFQCVIHLAAQAGVRYSIQNPHAYIQSNLVAFTNILEGCRNHQIRHLLYASSSSVYGANVKMPFSAHDNVDHPVSLYAATKKANELLAHTYSHLYGLPTTGLRFFTVYGPWGRPDMAYFSFTKNIIEDKTIQVFNHGLMRRDFTYIDDIVEGIVRLMNCPPTENRSWDREFPDPASSYAPYRIFNIGNNQPEELMLLINIIEELVGKKARVEFKPMQQGDVVATYADIQDIQQLVDFKPATTLRQGLERFVGWYMSYYSKQGNEVRTI
ncbi:NAD-dependent epimerase [Paenibacillus montanisoli]|uniref:Capsular biosynthesis protein CpsI n=1 Tax=Paenibacillus montanisoli TaxID=2081970 RepID=A0A328U3T0_9BACL|nr:NAD-dependent epimerase [Paenibacillus montanisoli]RAP77477.1 capsular biosynthesis protein CpsI [Paenibacillus montanisoli]